jgi:hypothetical protein
MKGLHVWTVLLAAMAIVVPVIAPLVAPAAPEAAQESALIEKAVRDYIDGWYEGDAERMERALHPDLAKRRVNFLPDGTGVLQTLSADAMIAYTRLGGGKKDRQPDQHNDVVILDVSSHTASVKTVSHQFIDYLHLARIGGQWRIVNVLWEPRH